MVACICWYVMAIVTAFLSARFGDRVEESDGVVIAFFWPIWWLLLVFKLIGSAAARPILWAARRGEKK